MLPMRHLYACMHGSLKYLASHFNLLFVIIPSLPSFLLSFLRWLLLRHCHMFSRTTYLLRPPTTLPWAQNLDAIRRFALTILRHRVPSKPVRFTHCITFYIICEIWHFPSVSSGVWKCILVGTYNVLEESSVSIHRAELSPSTPKRETARTWCGRKVMRLIFF